MRLLSGIAGLAWAQIVANLGRSFYFIAAVAITMAAILVISALNPSANYGASNEIGITSARGGMLPLRYMEIIEKLPGVAATTSINYLPLLCSSGATATLNGYGGSGTRAMLEASYVIDPAVIAAWESDPLGILVGEKLARQCGWNKGMHPQPRDGFLGREREVHIIDTVPGRSESPFADQIAIAHFDYLNRQAEEGQRDLAASIVVRALDPATTAPLAATIDARFAAADPPTESQPNSAAENVLQRFGQISAVLYAVIAAMLACLALVLVSALAHTAAQRRTEFAVLRVLGFTRRFVFAAFACEFVVLLILGIALGCALGSAVIAGLASAVGRVIGRFAPPASVWASLPLILTLLLALALILPARSIAVLRPIDAAR